MPRGPAAHPLTTRAERAGRAGWATASAVLGALAVPWALLVSPYVDSPVLIPLPAALAVLLGLRRLRQLRSLPQLRGRGSAVFGVTIGVLFLLLFALLLWLVDVVADAVS